MAPERDELLRMTDEELSGSVVFEFYKGSGPGGQKRNKSSSAVRATLPEFGLSVTDCTERSQHRNRANALRKLRMAAALKLRQSPAAPPPRAECAVTAPDYPLFAACLLDVMEEAGYDHRAAAGHLGWSPSALIKKLRRDPILWMAVNAARRIRGLAALHD